MPAEIEPNDAFVKLAQNLGELEVVIGPRAREAIAQVRAGLSEAIASRQRGDMSAAIDAIRRAMARLAALGAELDPQEGAMMRAIAERFTSAMVDGARGDMKASVDTMRRKAGDSSDGGNNDW